MGCVHVLGWIEICWLQEGIYFSVGGVGQIFALVRSCGLAALRSLRLRIHFLGEDCDVGR